VISIRLAWVCTLSAVVLALAGCGSPAVPPAPAPSTPPPGSSGKLGVRPEAGIADLGGGRVIASGWVAYEELEGGFWAVMDIEPSTSSVVQPKVVAVLLPGKVGAEQMKAAEGTFVAAEGVVQEGASIRMTGPEIVVDALRAY
jgi:hypothetical protein